MPTHDTDLSLLSLLPTPSTLPANSTLLYLPYVFYLSSLPYPTYYSYYSYSTYYTYYTKERGRDM